MTKKIPTVLEKIVRTRRGHLEDIRSRIAHIDPATLPLSTRSLEESLGQRGANSFIMECKASSPSLGLIRENYNPADIARVYSRYAAGISVLCEPEFFGGDYDHLAAVAQSTHLPVLCKDFIIDEVQIHAARYFGADAVLLMLSVLEDDEYSRLSAEAARLGMDVLTEVIDVEEVDRAIALGAHIFGVNHRNLHDLSIDLERSAQLSTRIPSDRVLVSESGIRDNRTVRALGGHSTGFLVGSQLSAQPDIDRAARALVFGNNKVCGLRTPAAAQAARAAGARFGGLIFEDASPRNVSRETACRMIELEPGLDWVVVSRRTSGYGDLLTDLPTQRIYAVQIHAPFSGDIEAERALISSVSAELADYPHVQLWRALNMEELGSAAAAIALLDDGLIEHVVLDCGDGGSGRSFDWTTIPDGYAHRCLLAGGISEDNLDAALAAGCYGLDLNSGVEYPASSTRHHHKDVGAIARVFERLRRFSYPSGTHGVHDDHDDSHHGEGR